MVNVFLSGFWSFRKIFEAILSANVVFHRQFCVLSCQKIAFHIGEVSLCQTLKDF